MDSSDPIIQYGASPGDDGIIDEPALLIQSITWTPGRELKTYKGGNQATNLLRYVDPKMKIEFDAIISEFSGLANQHPGTLVDGLLNYESPVHGFDPEQGIMVYEDPVRSQNTDDPSKVKFNVVQYPFVNIAA